MPGALDRVRRSQVISTPRTGGTENAVWSFLECSWQEESEGKEKMRELILAETALQAAQDQPWGETSFGQAQMLPGPVWQV